MMAQPIKEIFYTQKDQDLVSLKMPRSKLFMKGTFKVTSIMAQVNLFAEMKATIMRDLSFKVRKADQVFINLTR